MILLASELSESGVNVADFAATALYSIFGIVLMVVSVVLIEKLFKLDLHKELVQDNNIAFGVLIGALAIAIAIIIGATVIS